MMLIWLWLQVNLNVRVNYPYSNSTKPKPKLRLPFAPSRKFMLLWVQVGSRESYRITLKLITVSHVNRVRKDRKTFKLILLLSDLC